MYNLAILMKYFLKGNKLLHNDIYGYHTNNLKSTNSINITAQFFRYLLFHMKLNTTNMLNSAITDLPL